MGNAADTRWIAERAKSLGFNLCGIVRAETFAEMPQFAEWLRRGYAGQMSYLHDVRRQEPSLVMDGIRSAIVCALNYNTDHPYSVDAAAAPAADRNTNAPAASHSTANAPRGWISRYAWGRDYHEVLWEKLNALSAALPQRFTEPFAARAYADTGPLAERLFAKHAGLGWTGKNTLLLNEKLGSWFFLGVIVTSLELAPSLAPGEAPPPDLCGNCRQCLDACPTGALVEPYVLDARRCISYLTIELRGSIPQEFREPIGWQVYGCDICQDVCPFNRNAPTTPLADFEPRATAAGDTLLQPRLEWLAGMTEQQFRESFRGSAMKRTKWSGLVRNACIALGNMRMAHGTAGHSRVVALLENLSASSTNVIAESAQWALSRIKEGNR